MIRSISALPLVIASLLVMHSCARTTTTLADLTPAQRARVIEMRVLGQSELQGAKVRTLGSIEGLSCQTGTLDSPPAEAEAIRDTKMRAAGRGANALTNLVCESTGLSWAHNCSDSIRCYAEALVVSDIRPSKNAVPPAHHQPSVSPPPSAARKISVGTGWMVSQGFAITNWHVVEGHDKITLRFQSGQRVGATLSARDVNNDVALLSPVEEEHNRRPAIPLASGVPKMGEPVFTIGFPAPELMGQAPKLTSGIISSLTGIEDDPRFLQMSVPIQPGNSGGPLLNGKGEAVGMVTAKLNPGFALKSAGFLPENVGYAIKVDYLVPLLRTVPHPSTTREVPPEAADLSDLAFRVGPAVVQVEAE